MRKYINQSLILSRNKRIHKKHQILKKPIKPLSQVRLYLNKNIDDLKEKLEKIKIDDPSNQISLYQFAQLEFAQLTESEQEIYQQQRSTLFKEYQMDIKHYNEMMLEKEIGLDLYEKYR